MVIFSLRARVAAGVVSFAAALAIAPAVPAASAVSAEPVEISLPGTGVTLFENSADRLHVTSYNLSRNRTYLRDRSRDSFARKANYSEYTVSPGGGRAAGVSTSYTSAGFDTLVLLERGTGKSMMINTVRKPLTASYAFWSRDGSKIALTAERKSGGKWRTVGYAVVDVAARVSRYIPVPDVDPAGTFRWAADSTHLIVEHKDGVRFHRAGDGRVVRHIAKVGPPAGGEEALSPSGRLLTTWCPIRYAEKVCVIDRATGQIKNRVPTKAESLWGWWDESHVIAVVPKDGGYQAVVGDLRGRTVRVLAEISSSAYRTDKVYLSFTRK
ncbi:hypothetical protein SAMN05421505_102255 [Sinosporangium album]|uniref:WD40-like Beta Propeller Repeat n=1 Tax=Sinosporangium album TaxID=504805 RepID=A0A1G7SEZ2_9ACTN|nr:hypothetical protein [Sinosporangium album]SDG20760.1 hypothetical protein SAMN05421505_102255 [Sinosporangium album]